MVAEFELLAGLRRYLDGDGPRLPRGVGDDAAVVDVDGPVVAAVDTLVDGVHLDRRWSSPSDLGFKALSVNVSDLVAMGALPLAALVSLQLPSACPADEVEGVYTGLREAADRWGCRLVGGDTVTSPTLAVSLTILGGLHDVDVVLRRDAASPGQLVVLIGALGLAAAGLELHRRGEEELLAAHPELSEAHRRPVALTEAVVPLTMAGVTAAIDVSDGLGRDLGHLATDSQVGIRVDADRLPRAAGVVATAERLGLDPLELVLGGGEDQALAVTLPAESLGRLDTGLEAVGLRARVIGEVVADTGVTVDGADVAARGWEHR